MLRCMIFNDDAYQLKELWQTLKEKPDLELVVPCVSTREVRDILDYARIPRPDHTVYFLCLNPSERELSQSVKLCQSILRLDAHAYVIFVSAWSQFALACCKAHAFDFLLAPFTFPQLLSSVEAVQQDIYRREQELPLIVKTGGHILRVNMKNILYFCRDRDHLNAITLTDSIRWRESFVSLFSRLNQKMFVRSHNSFIVNIQYVMEINTESNLLHMVNGADVPYSRRNEQDLFYRLNQQYPWSLPHPPPEKNSLYAMNKAYWTRAYNRLSIGNSFPARRDVLPLPGVQFEKVKGFRLELPWSSFCKIQDS